MKVKLYLLIILLIISLAACLKPVDRPSLPTPTNTPELAIPHSPTSRPTLIPSLTSTQEPSPSSTIIPSATKTAPSTPTHIIYPTHKSTQTPAATRTPTDIPTATALVPPPEAGIQYRLKDWSPEEADRLIATLIAYPDGLDYTDRGRYDSIYYASYWYASEIQAESTSRFPHATQVDQWKWGRLDTALLGRGGVPEIASDLILTALNQDKIPIDNLKSWFETNNSQLSLELIPVTLPPSGYTSSQIVTLREGVRPAPDNYDPINGAAFIWLLQKNDVYEAFPLLNGFGLLDVTSSVDLVDLTGDGSPEAIIPNIHWQSFNMHGGTFTIYDLSQTPP